MCVCGLQKFKMPTFILVIGSHFVWMCKLQLLVNDFGLSSKKQIFVPACATRTLYTVAECDIKSIALAIWFSNLTLNVSMRVKYSCARSVIKHKAISPNWIGDYIYLTFKNSMSLNQISYSVILLGLEDVKLNFHGLCFVMPFYLADAVKQSLELI